MPIQSTSKQLWRDVQVFDGLVQLDEAMTVLIEGGRIAGLWPSSTFDEAHAQGAVEAGCGGVLTPGDFREFSLRYMGRIVEGLTRVAEGRRVPVILFAKGGGHWLHWMVDTGCDALGVDWTIDLDDAGRFNASELELLPGLLRCRHGDGTETDLPLRPGLSLRHADHGGVATLSVHDAQQRLAGWRFTLAQNPAALRLARQFDRQIGLLQTPQGETGADDAPPLCPSCQSVLPPDSDALTNAAPAGTASDTFRLVRLPML